VAGKVVDIHPELMVGGFIRAGEKILQIDSRDYELAVQQADATVQDAKVKLDTEQAEADVARKEWSQLNPGTEPTSLLVLREPQIRKAQAALESAEAQLAVAKLKLERTSLSLPFDALIISEQVDLGQYIVAGQSLASAYGADAIEIQVPLEDKELAWFDVFDLSVLKKTNNTTTKQTTALVRAHFAGAEHTWQGRVVRTTGQVDRTSRMIPIIIEVAEPFDSSEGRPPLLPGIFADVYIEGRVLKNAFAIPRDAIREGNKVWLVNDNILHIRTLNIVRADKEFAYTNSGIYDGAQIITSSLDVVIEGMQVRTQGDSAESSIKSAPHNEEPADTEAE
jgi:RND family efflux transporter MFP subunit